MTANPSDPRQPLSQNEIDQAIRDGQGRIPENLDLEWASIDDLDVTVLSDLERALDPDD